MIGTSYPILAICRVDATHDSYYSCAINGKHSLNGGSHHDLFFAPEKHEGWANLYKDNDHYYLGSSFFISKKAKQKNLSGRIVVM